MKKKKTDMLQGMFDLLILRSLRGGPLNGWDITYEPTKGA